MGLDRNDLDLDALEVEPGTGPRDRAAGRPGRDRVPGARRRPEEPDPQDELAAEPDPDGYDSGPNARLPETDPRLRRRVGPDVHHHRSDPEGFETGNGYAADPGHPAGHGPGYDVPPSGSLPDPHAFWVRDSQPVRQDDKTVNPPTDGMWLDRLSRPVTPESLFQPRQSQKAVQQTYRQGHETRLPDLRPPQPGNGRPQSTGKPRLAWIDTARGLAILLVVFIHATEWIQESAVSIPLWDDINEIFSTLRMPLFFMCAGILATKWLYASWSDLIAKKVFFLGWVYLLWEVIGSGQAVVAAQITGDHLTPVRMLASLAMTPARPRFELWFIWALAIFFVLARFCSRFPLAPQLGISALLCVFTFSSLVPEVNLGWNGVVKYYLFFLIGCYYGPLLKALADRLTKAVGLAVTAGWLVLAVVTYLTGIISLPGIGLLVRVLGLFAGIGVALLLQDVKLFSYLGSRTLPIYLAHTPILVVLVFVINPIASSGAVQGIKWILPFLLTAPAVYLALLLNRTVMKTPARWLYAPPDQAIDLVWEKVAGQRSGLYSEKLDPVLVPGLRQRPFERQLERLIR